MEKSKIALVTGANRGIGLEVCRQLASLGYTVILSSRNEEKGKKALQQIQSSGDLVYYPLDVNDEQSIASMLGWVKSRYGRLDILVNNAGINYDTWHTALKADLQESHETIEANLFGPWRMCQAFIPLMQQGGYGRVVNVSSGAGALNGMGGGTPAYSMSKAALNVLTIKLAANTISDNILVNTVCPGWVRTDMGGANAPRSVEEGAKGIVWAATLENDGPSGKFFRDGKPIAW
jgi:NAD(P)-dependent dehydrogenase (short-subunit alcohol dehydrogenase family)